MKYVTILLVAIIALGQTLNAKSCAPFMCNDSTEVKKTVFLSDSTETNYNNAYAINSALAITVENLQKQTEDDKAIIKMLRDSINLLESQYSLLNQDIAMHQKDKANALNEMKKWENKYYKLSQDISRLDALVFKQCLLYPLEARYDAISIQEALTAVSSFANMPIQKSDDFTSYRNTYEPLLRDYKKYNDEIIVFFEKELATLKVTGGIVKSAHKDKFLNELVQVTYYKQCYLNRNKKPYKSIIYLDQAIDKFLDLIKSNNAIDGQLEELINGLKPKI